MGKILILNYFRPLFFFVAVVVVVGFWSWLADKLSFSSLVMKLDFMSQPSSNSTLPFAR
jgi:hypothetical protein